MQKTLTLFRFFKMKYQNVRIASFRNKNIECSKEFHVLKVSDCPLSHFLRRGIFFDFFSKRQNILGGGIF